MIKSIKTAIDELIEEGATNIMFEVQAQDIKFNAVVTSSDNIFSPANEKCLTVDTKTPSGKDMRTIIPFSAIKIIKVYAV